MTDEHPGVLPLFPLPSVLFPGMPFPLHIFEPRYRELLQQCIDNDTPFGIVRTRMPLIGSGHGGSSHEAGDAADLHRVGCSAEVISVLKRYPGGEFDILARGRHRFRLRGELIRTHDYLQSRVQWFDDAPDTPDELAVRPLLTTRVIELVRELAARSDASDDLAQKVAEQSPTRPSFVFGRTLGFPLDFQCRLLDSRSESNRLKQIVSRLDAMWLELRIRRARESSDLTPDWPGKSSYGYAGPAALTATN